MEIGVSPIEGWGRGMLAWYTEERSWVLTLEREAVLAVEPGKIKSSKWTTGVDIYEYISIMDVCVSSLSECPPDM